MRVTKTMGRVTGVSRPAGQWLRSATQEGKGRGKATKEEKERN